MAKALESDPIGETQTAFRALTQGERREFLRWAAGISERTSSHAWAGGAG